LGLSLALALSSIDATVLSLATDGWDGNSSLAGMIATTRPLGDPVLAQEAYRALDSHDTAPFLEGHGMAVRTGKTGSNLNDLLVVVVPGPEKERL
jgi:hydroxypyruvate reductase